MNPLSILLLSQKPETPQSCIAVIPQAHGWCSLQNTPLIVLGNKRDLVEALGEEELIARMHLKDITDREVAFYTISAKNQENIETTIEWFLKHNNK